MKDKKIVICALFCLVVFFISLHKVAVDKVSAAPTLAIGMNLNPINDWSPEWAFVDRMKNARAWIVSNADGSGPWSSGITVPMDGFGYPLQIPYDPDGAGPVAPQTVKTFLFLDIGTHYPKGAYTLIFDGSGTINLRFDATGTFTQTQSGVRHTVQIPNPSDSGVLLTITRSDPNNPVKNIRFIMPGFVDTYQTQPFHPLYLNYLKPFTTIRFMDWEETNNSPLRRWADRTTPSHMSQARPQGVALEHIIDLCNTANKDCWLTIPHQADDDYIRQFATLAHNRLKANLKVYIEYSNEVWNPQFEQWHWVKDNSPFQNISVHYRRYARISQNVFTIFRSVFSDNPTRVVRVLSGQVVNIWHLQEALQETYNVIGGTVDAIAIAPYVGVFNDGLNAQSTSAEILTRMRTVIKDYRIPELIEHKKLADQYKIRLIAYEGGTAVLPTTSSNDDPLMGPFRRVQRDPDIYNVYNEMLQAFFGNGMDLIMQFNLMSQWDRWGMWGALQWMDEDPLTLPKYRALAEWAGSPPLSQPLPPPQAQPPAPVLPPQGNAPISDTIPPQISNGLPSGDLAAGTTQATLSLTTNENATCRYGTSTGANFSQMTNTFTVTGSTNHATTIIALQEGRSYTYYVRCQDAAGNVTTSDFPIIFSVAASSIALLPTDISTQTSSAVIIDGQVMEWGSIAGVSLPATRNIATLGSVIGDSDASGTVKSAWDAQNIYFVVEVKDDKLMNDSANVWEDDSVELYIDGKNEKAKNYDVNDFQLTVRIDNALGGIRSSLASGISYAVTRQSNGYTVEYAIPFSLFGVTSGDGINLGYDIAINDDDDGGNRDAQLALYGNGTGWSNPSVFGNIRLNIPMRGAFLKNIFFTPRIEGTENIALDFTITIIDPTNNTSIGSFTSKPASGKIPVPQNFTLSEKTYDIFIVTPTRLKKKISSILRSDVTITLPFLEAGDINNDNTINAQDWSLMNASWFQPSPASDINGDGIVNSLDYSFLNKNWNKKGD